MTTLLHLQSSPRGDRSASTAVAARLAERYRQLHPDDTVRTLDLWNTDLPEITGPLLEAAYAAKQGRPQTAEQSDAWQSIVCVCDNFKGADKYVLSVPMWNFSIPYKLKHYLDVLVHSGLTFEQTPDGGYTGLVIGKPLVIVCARGGEYGPGSGQENHDCQIAYLRQMFRFIGFTRIYEVLVEPTATGHEAKQAAIEGGVAEAWKIAERL